MPLEIALYPLCKAKKKKIVCILSSAHKHVKVDESHKKKLPETVQLYNKSKVGVDVPDQMARYHTCKSSSRRWPVAMFFNILDCACINSFIIYSLVTKIKLTRRQFLLELIKGFASQKMAWIHQLHDEFQLKHPVLQTLSRFKEAEKEENVNLHHVATNQYQVAKIVEKSVAANTQLKK